MKIHCVLCNTNGVAGWLQSCFDKWLVVRFCLDKDPDFSRHPFLFFWGLPIFNVCRFSTSFRDSLTLKNMGFCMNGLLKHLRGKQEHVSCFSFALSVHY